jgi:hypothetical protein
MTDYNKVHQRSLQSLQSALAQENILYQQAYSNGDVDEMAQAAQNMAGMRATMRELNTMHREVTAAPSVAPGNPDMSARDQDLCRHYGLSGEDLTIAKGWTGDTRIPDTERDETYLRNKQRYQTARANGSYRDDQGYVRR